MSGIECRICGETGDVRECVAGHRNTNTVKKARLFEELQKRLAEAEKVIEFYAEMGDLFEQYGLCDDFSCVDIAANIGVDVVGKRARQYKHKYMDNKA